MIRALLFLFISIYFYSVAPNKYDFDLCLLYFIVFIINSFATIKSNLINKNYLNFHLIFAISFMFVNFIYPIFLYPTQRNFFVVFERFYFNDNYITASTALALVGYNSYSLGTEFIKKKSNYQINNINFQKTSLSLIRIIEKITFILGIIFLLILLSLTYNNILDRKSDSFFSVPSPILVLNQVFINLTILLNFYLYKFNKKFSVKLYLRILYILSYIFIYAYTGDRGSAIQTVLILLFAYSVNIKTIKPIVLSVIITLGMVILTVMSFVRSKDGGGDINLTEFEFRSSFDFAMDLIINNRNLYAGYDYVLKNGINYGKGTIYFLFSPIPFLPTYISNILFDANPSELTSAYILTNDARASYGLGTNLIIDLYMQFGFIGVIVLMLCLGLLLRYFESKTRVNIYNYLIVAFLFSFSLYMPRSTLFDVFRYISWALMIFAAFYYFFKPFLVKK